MLCAPFKRVVLDNVRNRGGMGLRLYLAHKIVTEHSGTIKYSYDAPDVIFTAEIPLAADRAS